jgi:putative heme-binding domain-containing protein
MTKARILSAVLLLGSAQDPSPDEGVKLILNPTRPMEQREEALKSLARTKAGGLAILALVDQEKLPDELRATASFALAASPDAEVKAQGEKKVPVLKDKAGAPFPPIAELTSRTGDAAAGEKVFRDPNSPKCIGCHQIAEDGKMVGPPLTTIGNKLSKAQLFEAILTPSAAILMSYENWAVRTKDGDVKTGIKVEDTDDHVTLKDTNGEFIDIPVGKIAEKKMLKLSMMPDNLGAAMRVQDLVDLVEFLSRQR